MRWHWILLTAMLVWPAVQPVQASGAVQLYDDPSGDVATWIAEEPSPLMPEWRAVDLLGLAVADSSQELTFEVDVDADAEWRPFIGTANYTIRFGTGHVAYEVAVQRIIPATGMPYWTAFVERADATTSTVQERIDVNVTASDAGFTVAVPRTFIIDGTQTPVQRGGTLTEVRAAAFASELHGTGSPVPGVAPTLIDIHDRVPDDRSAAIDYAMRSGPSTGQGVVMESVAPTRSSNGEATTYVYNVRIQNGDPGERTFALRHGDVPSGVLVWFPSQEMTLHPSEERRVPVLVTVPFMHEHGERLVVPLQAATSNATLASMDLAIQFTDPPQPAGHHDQLYLHAFEDGEDALGSPRYRLAMSTQREPPGAAAASVAGPVWRFPLDPSLRMGLDFNVSQTGRLQGELVPDYGGSDLSLQGELQLIDADGDIAVLATTEAEIPGAFEAGSTIPFDATVTPTSKADYVPYQAGTQLQLRLFASYQGPAATIIGPGVSLRPGAQLQLPLEEYHDRLGEQQGLALTAPTARVNPGEAVIVPIVMRNDAAMRRDVELFVQAAAPGVQLLSPDHHTLEPASKKSIEVAFQALPDAESGDVLEAVVIAASADNSTAFARISVAVVDDIDLTDDTEAVQDRQADRRSPGIGLLAMLGLIGVARRRR